MPDQLYLDKSLEPLMKNDVADEMVLGAGAVERLQKVWPEAGPIAVFVDAGAGAMVSLTVEQANSLADLLEQLRGHAA